MGVHVPLISNPTQVILLEEQRHLAYMRGHGTAPNAIDELFDEIEDKKHSSNSSEIGHVN